MLLQIEQLTEDDSYDLEECNERTTAWINIYLVESVTEDPEHADRCNVYMQSQDFFYVNESSDSFIKRYQEALFGTVLTRFYDKSNRQT